MIHHLSDRVNQIPPSGIRAFFDLVLGSDDIISLGVGEPDFITPWRIREEAIYRLEKGFLNYTSNKGLLDLRLEISRRLKRQFNLEYSSDELLVTNGVSEGIDLVCRACLNPGDEVILPEPAYVCYRPLVELCGGIIQPINTAASDFIPLASDIEPLITNKTKAIFLSYPSNPTGQSIPFDELIKISRLVKEHDILLVTDEIYADLSFVEFQSVGTLSDIRNHLIYLNGFSKGHSMTGWRVGYIAAPEGMVEAMNKIHQYSALCAPTISQFAALEACRTGYDEVIKMKQSYQQRATYFTKKMNDMGLSTLMPKGGLYCFSSIQSTGFTSMEFAEKLLREYRVAVVPGHVFGLGGEGYIRSCIATDFDQLKHAVGCIESFVSSQHD